MLLIGKSLKADFHLFPVGYMTLSANLLAFFYRTYIALFLTNDIPTAAFLLSSLVALQNIVQIPLRIPLSELSQSIGRKPLILTGTASYTISLLVLSLATHWTFVLISVLLFAFGISCFWPAVFSLLGDVSKTNYGANNGRVFQFSDIGVLLASLIAYITLQYLNWDLRQLFLTGSILGVVLTVFGYFILNETLNGSDRRHYESLSKNFLKSLRTMVSTLKELLKSSGLRKVYSLQILISYTEFGFAIFLPLLVVDNYHYSNSDVSLMYFVSIFLLIGLKKRFGVISDRFGLERPVIFALIINGLLIYMITLNGNFAYLILIYSLVLSGLLISYPAVNSHASKFSTPEMRGSAIGSLGVFVSIGRGLGAIVMGVFLNFLPLTPSFQFFGISIILLTFILLIIFKK